eukprot:COSAG05_NODE_1805_length_4045_cov_24.194015_5_plen_76_part_00
MQELVRAYNIATGSVAQASCACSPLHRDEEERQREEAKRALAGPVQLDVVRAAPMQRLASPTSRGTSPTYGVGNV